MGGSQDLVLNIFCHNHCPRFPSYPPNCVGCIVPCHRHIFQPSPPHQFPLPPHLIIPRLIHPTPLIDYPLPPIVFDFSSYYFMSSLPSSSSMKILSLYSLNYPNSYNHILSPSENSSLYHCHHPCLTNILLLWPLWLASSPHPVIYPDPTRRGGLDMGRIASLAVFIAATANQLLILYRNDNDSNGLQ